ncbi:hypothetical protein CLV31_1298 [Algoriphagus aquaeductus]|mgnify:CR=1 FL=1|jgi:hypothetical protein|uniref:Uncharacterized protein n=1 Tax=Algoriphagus aquaeductus TaxID=475299 RepID=A0A326RJU8_9BACT|nr:MULTISPECIES: hypothetical protein [Algoriphagus]PZV76012.1 hypothetical protein CLV31_1298 [Algoriphagus aquaeductus]
MDGLTVWAVGGGVIALLLSTIAYFLKLLIEDLRQMGKELGKLKEVVVRLQSEQALIKTLLQQAAGSKTRKIPPWPE